MIIKPVPLPLVALQPVALPTGRSDAGNQNQTESARNKKQDASGSATQFTARDIQRINALREQAATNASRSSTRTISDSTNRRIQDALAQYQQNANPELDAEKQHIQLLFGIDVIA